jgi:hypothetical protein
VDCRRRYLTGGASGVRCGGPITPASVSSRTASSNRSLSEPSSFEHPVMTSAMTQVDAVGGERITHRVDGKIGARTRSGRATTESAEGQGALTGKGDDAERVDGSSLTCSRSWVAKPACDNSARCSVGRTT